jgi:hypothetical protein
VAYELVPGLRVTPEIAYFDNFDDNDDEDDGDEIGGFRPTLVLTTRRSRSFKPGGQPPGFMLEGGLSLGSQRLLSRLVS